MINAYRNKDCDNVTIIVGNFQDIEPNIDEQFDYITLIGVWEYAALYVDGTDPYLQMLEIAKKHLKKDGKIIIAIENKMGLKYWNGAPEDHTNNLYSGLNDYIDNKNVRTFSNIEIEKLLETAYIKNYSFIIPCQIISCQRQYIPMIYCQKLEQRETMGRIMIPADYIILMMRLYQINYVWIRCFHILQTLFNYYWRRK